MDGDVALSFAGSVIIVPGHDYSLLAPHSALGPFEAVHNEAPSFRLRRSSCGDGLWTSLSPASGGEGGYRWTPDGLEVHPETSALGIVLALRGLFSRAIERRGGVLVHGSAVAWGGNAALVTGVSGAGKSTLARWCVAAGGHLLSDEVVGVLPNGMLLGTPFRSDPDLMGTRIAARLRLVTTVVHGDEDLFVEAPPHELVGTLCEQAFRRGGELSGRDVLRCIANAVEAASAGVFTCRNAASAGEALRARVLEGAPIGNA